MANFVKAAGEKPTGWFDGQNGILTVTVGQPVYVGLAYGYNADGTPFEVRFNDFDGPGCVATVAPQDPDRPAVRTFKIEPKRTGNVMLEARLPVANKGWFDWPLYASLQVAVTAVPSALEEQVQNLFYEGVFAFLPNGSRERFAQAMNGRAVGGRAAQHSPELLKLLVKLAPAGLLIMRTFDPPKLGKDGKEHAQGPHGEIDGDKLICRGVDISGYAGFKFHYTVPRELLIQGVERLFRDLPGDLQYEIGFVRPVGGLACDESRDVFFPVPPERIAAAYSPDGSWGVGKMLEPAKTRVLAALAGKRVNYMYPDGADHIHMKVF